jgi:uncharacterized lipoprotein
MKNLVLAIAVVFGLAACSASLTPAQVEYFELKAACDKDSTPVACDILKTGDQ